MNTPRFWMSPLAPGRAELSPEEARHAAQSRRLSADEALVLFDGQGHEADARIIRVARRQVVVQIGQVADRPRSTPQLTLATAIPKGHRQDSLVEKCTELGCAGLIPLRTLRSVATASAQRIAGWQRTAIEAAKQSGQAWLPEFAAMHGLSEAAALVPSYDQAWIATVPGETLPGTIIHPADLFADAARSKRILAFVGPEGGWEASELELLLAAGARPVCLGPNTLRIETAGLALAALVHAMAQPPLQSHA